MLNYTYVVSIVLFRLGLRNRLFCYDIFIALLPWNLLLKFCNPAIFLLAQMRLACSEGFGLPVSEMVLKRGPRGGGGGICKQRIW